MNKMKKLLSVVLAVVLALSCMSVAASAAKTEYKTVENLTSLSAYSTYGEVTRLSTEERSSMILDFLDQVLPGLNINLGTVIDLLGITITINLTSVDNLCASLDSIQDAWDNTLFSIVKGIFNLGILEKLDPDSWESGMTRDGYDQLTILLEIMELLSTNTSLVEAVFTDGLELGMIGNFMTGMDFSSINKIVLDLPSMLKGIIVPMFQRWNHTTTECEQMDNVINGTSTDYDGVVALLDKVVYDYFSTDMSLTTVKADSTGAITSDHTLPTSDTRRTYTKSGTTITVKEYYTTYDANKSDDDDITAAGYYLVGTYTLQQEVGSDDYVFVMTSDAEGLAVENGEALKYYKNDSAWLPDFADALNAGTETFSITTESAATLLYKMIPYVFDAMAPVVVNGSLKKLLSGFFGVEWTNLGDINDIDTSTIVGYDASLEVFGEQGEYLWEWTAFDVVTVDGKDYYYYRYQDDLFEGDAEAKPANEYMEIINWDYKITGDFLTKYIPSAADGSSTSEAGYTRILHAVNQFVYDLAAEVLSADFFATLNLVEGDNSNLVENVKALAQGILGYSPERIFGETFDADGNSTGYGKYFDLLMTEDNDDLVLTGIAALAVDALADQMILPDGDSLAAQNVKVGGILAAMLRELATQLLPSIDYDALIYSDYNTKTFVADKDNSYWLDVIMTIATDIGYKYLTAFADMNEDTLGTWFAVGGCIDWQLERTYTEADLKLDSAVNLWEQRVDFIIDWALYVDSTGTYCVWNMNNFVQEYLDAAGCTYDVGTAEDPWTKLDAVLDNILFFDQFTSTTDLEDAVRGTILDLFDLNWENILGTSSITGLIDIPTSSRLRSTNLVECLTLEVRDLINGLFKNIGGGSFYLINESYTSIDDILVQDVIKSLASNLIGALYSAAGTNGLFTTVFPFVNFILGWKTSPQTMSDPNVYGSYRDAMPYMYVYGTAIEYTTISFQNNSSGMLETHRNSSVVDHPYQIQILEITDDADTELTYTFTGDGYADPYETEVIDVTGTYLKDEAVTFTIKYQFIGKDGNVVGDPQYTAITTFITNLYADERYVVTGESSESVAQTNYSPYVFTEDIYGAVTGYTGKLAINPGTVSSVLGSNVSRDWKSTKAPDTYEGVTGTDSCGDDVTGDIEYTWDGYAKTYFSMYQNQDGGWVDISTEGTTSTTGYFFYANSGYDATTEYPYGTYLFPQIAVKYATTTLGIESGADSKVWTVCFVHYDDYDIPSIASDYQSKNITKYSVDTTDSAAVAAYEAYNDALQEAVRLANYPKMVSNGTNQTLTSATGTSANDYVTAIMPQIPDAITALEEAYEALEPYMEAATDASAEGASTGLALLEAELAKDVTDEDAGTKEINFQDYEYYEYFNYADRRTAARNLVKTMYAPAVLDEYYIEGSGITYAELKKVIAAETNTNIATGIDNSKVATDAADYDYSVWANENFVAPYYTYLYLADQASLLAYYKQFIIAVDADLTFLNREIAYAEANYPMSNESLYTAGSWATYEAAYEKAKAITADDLPSVVFTAKFELMRAEKDLLLKTNALNEAGGVDNLKALVEEANAIFATATADLTLSDDAIAAGYTVETALAELIKATGYYYVGEDGNTWNLYADSALEYIDNDRPNKSTNKANVKTAEANLTTAIELFATEEVLPELGVVDGTTGVIGETTTDEAGVVTGYIYGVAAGTTIETNFALVDSTAGYTVKVASTLAGASTDGTGAKLQVYNNSDVLVAEYTLVVFGDVDGTGTITTTDEAYIMAYNMGDTANAVATDKSTTMAADVDGTGTITTTDEAYVMSYNMGDYTAVSTNPY